jgi:SNF2 family DNA or RNA helicase
MAGASASSSGSKSSSHSKDAPLLYSLLTTPNTESKARLSVSWKQLRKRWPWLKQLKKPQRRGVEAASSIDGFAALFEQRTGKTWVTVALLAVELDITHDVLLVGPLTNLESTWGKTLREKVPEYRVHRSLEEYDEHKKVWKKQWGDTPDWNILLLNPEQVTPIRDKLRRRRWDRFIWDEAHRLKNRSSQSSRDAALIAKSAQRRLALTGTPMDLDPKDLWAIMRFVDAEVLGDVWKDFEKKYLVQPSIDLKKKMGMIQRQKMLLAHAIAKRKAPMREDKIKKFAKKLRKNVMRITKEDMGIDRAKIHLIEFPLAPEERKKYDQLQKTMVVKAKGQTITTPLKITQIGKLQQITGGHIKDEDGEVHRIGTSKRRQLRKLIEKKVKPGKPFVVFCKYVWEVHMIHRLLERGGYGRGASLWGKVKDLKIKKRRTDMLLAFQRGDLDWMVCQQKTGGVGVDLYRARLGFVYSMGHSFIDYDQMMSRFDFLQQNDAADIYILMAERSIDTDIASAVVKKKSNTERFYVRLND